MAHEDGARGLDERVVDGRDAASREVGGQLHGAEGGVKAAHQLAVGAGQAGPGAQVPSGRAGAPPRRGGQCRDQKLLTTICPGFLGNISFLLFH